VAEPAPVAPELLRYVDDYIDETDLGTAIEDALDADANLLVFVRELFAQIFANVIREPLTGPTAANAQRANVLRRKNRSEWPASLGRLVGHFQRWTKTYDDLIGEGYGGGSEARGAFHFEFIPSVLTDLEAWSIETSEDELSAAVTLTRQRYDEFLSSLDPDE
jgi:hypothetical protein